MDAYMKKLKIFLGIYKMKSHYVNKISFLIEKLTLMVVAWIPLVNTSRCLKDQMRPALADFLNCLYQFII